MQPTASPALPRRLKPVPGGFRQTVTIVDDSGREVAAVVWQELAAQPGVYQLLHAEVGTKHRRRGHGSTCLEAAVQQMQQHATRAGEPLRRLIALVNQPDVIARAWLQRAGFVHVHTLTDLLAEDEVLLLQRTFD